MKGIALKGRELALAIAAWVTYAVSWFVPTIDLFGKNIGWEAFGYSLRDLFQPEEFWRNRVLGIASVLANALVLISPWVFRKERTPAWFATVLALTFLLNLDYLEHFKPASLLVGYWMWIASIGVLAGIAVVRVLRSRSVRTLPVAPAS